MKKVLAILFVLFLFTACSEKEQNSQIDLSFKTTEADANASNQFVTVTADGDWTLTLSFGTSAENWAYLSDLSGKGTRKDIVLTWEKNSSNTERSVDITLSSAGKTVVRTFKQSASSSPTPTVIKPDPVGGWMELPEVKDPKLYFFTHSMTLGQKTTRNYSFYWDVDALVARWVAYPLNAWTISSGSRTNAWGLDPKLPKDCQPVLFKGYKGDEYMERGHQCPSADRLLYAANVQTFYGTNMTPQRAGLNEEAWGYLEGMVRDWSRQLDTLYVVTGCLLRGSDSYSYDNDGKKVKIPTGYYKALLGYKKSGSVGITSTTYGYTAIGFYFDHKDYPSDYQTVMAQSMTISELEHETGVDFFVNLPDAIGQELADKVEKTKDSWWK